MQDGPRERRKMGRPVGARDKQPRTRRSKASAPVHDSDYTGPGGYRIPSDDDIEQFDSDLDMPPPRAPVGPAAPFPAFSVAAVPCNLVTAVPAIPVATAPNVLQTLWCALSQPSYKYCNGIYAHTGKCLFVP